MAVSGATNDNAAAHVNELVELMVRTADSRDLRVSSA
jgi:hypothetical protein